MIGEKDAVAQDDLTITLPQGYKVKFFPEDVNLDTKFASYTKKSTLEDGKLSIQKRFVLKVREISEGKFGEFKNMITKINTEAQKNIILEKAEKKD